MSLPSNLDPPTLDPATLDPATPTRPTDHPLAPPRPRFVTRPVLRARRRVRTFLPELPRRQKDQGQTTAEYGLVILAAGSLALAAILWARNSGSITGLFQSVIDQLTGNLG